MSKNKGFTLVELAISLTIIAAILASVINGVALKKQAELRGVITEMNQMRDSFLKFVDIYHAIPGDFDQANTLWAGDCAITVTCNGNNNGYINTDWLSSSNETGRALKHMQRAGVLNYTIEQIPSSWDGVHNNYNITVKSAYRDVGIVVVGGTGDLGGAFATPSPFSSLGNTTHAVLMGNLTNNGGLTARAFSSKESFNIDSKIDDGAINASNQAVGASTGFFRVVRGDDNNSNCVTGANYQVTNDAIACLIGLQIDNRQ